MLLEFNAVINLPLESFHLRCPPLDTIQWLSTWLFYLFVLRHSVEIDRHSNGIRVPIVKPPPFLQRELKIQRKILHELNASEEVIKGTKSSERKEGRTE